MCRWGSSPRTLRCSSGEHKGRLLAAGFVRPAPYPRHSGICRRLSLFIRSGHRISCMHVQPSLSSILPELPAFRYLRKRSVNGIGRFAQLTEWTVNGPSTIARMLSTTYPGNGIKSIQPRSYTSKVFPRHPLTNPSTQQPAHSIKQMTCDSPTHDSPSEAAKTDCPNIENRSIARSRDAAVAEIFIPDGWMVGGAIVLRQSLAVIKPCFQELKCC